ncbi:hypothetical protein ZWY2020_053671 [Hordeum vulgare]|nr:hypothetical protein ZWY2020_053671 [Hordeum vulgare]
MGMAMHIRRRLRPDCSVDRNYVLITLPSRAAAQDLGRRPNHAVAPAPTATKASTPSALSSQFRLADFDKLAVLGCGNGGTVYKVRHRETSALYALKVQHYGDPAEADVLSRTASPFVVRCRSVLPAAASGDVALLAHPFVAGRDVAASGRRRLVAVG